MEKFDVHTDERGSLSIIDLSKIPFVPKRVFSVYDVPAGTVRGKHAHWMCQQYLFCVKGKIEVGYFGITDLMQFVTLQETEGIFIN